MRLLDYLNVLSTHLVCDLMTVTPKYIICMVCSIMHLWLINEMQVYGELRPPGGVSRVTSGLM